MSKDIHLSDVSASFKKLGSKLRQVAPMLFFLIVAAMYGFLLLQIMLLSNVQPKDNEVKSQISRLNPNIDQKAAQQLQSLEDNSVNVQTLFNDARNNPFGE